MSHQSVAWEHLTFAYMVPIRNALEKFAKENDLKPPMLWYHDSTVCFVSGNEKPFIRSMQTSIYQDENGFFVEIIPELYRDDNEKRKRYICELIPTLLIRTVPLPALPLTPENIEKFSDELANELFAAWKNTYFITLDTLITEIKLSPQSS